MAFPQARREPRKPCERFRESRRGPIGRQGNVTMNFQSDFAMLIDGRLTEAADSIEAVNRSAVLANAFMERGDHVDSAVITWIRS